MNKIYTVTEEDTYREDIAGWLNGPDGLFARKFAAAGRDPLDAQGTLVLNYPLRIKSPILRPPKVSIVADRVPDFHGGGGFFAEPDFAGDTMLQVLPFKRGDASTWRVELRNLFVRSIPGVSGVDFEISQQGGIFGCVIRDYGEEGYATYGLNIQGNDVFSVERNFITAKMNNSRRILGAVAIKHDHAIKCVDFIKNTSHNNEIFFDLGSVSSMYCRGNESEHTDVLFDHGYNCVDCTVEKQRAYTNRLVVRMTYERWKRGNSSLQIQGQFESPWIQVAGGYLHNIPAGGVGGGQFGKRVRVCDFNIQDFKSAGRLEL